MRHVYFLSLLCLLSLQVQAQPSPSPSQGLPFGAFLGLTVGYDWSSVNQSSDVLLLSQAPAPDKFTANGDFSSALLYGASLGLEFPLPGMHSRWQTSVAYYRSGEFTVSGTEYMFGASNLGNKAYHYDVENQRLMLENKFMFSLLERYYNKPGFYLYLMGGLGLSRNNASNYVAYSLEDTTITVGEFGSNSADSFSYSVGFGIEAEFASFFRMGLGYRYADLGKVSLGTFDSGNTSETLTTTQMPTQELVFHLTIL